MTDAADDLKDKEEQRELDIYFEEKIAQLQAENKRLKEALELVYEAYKDKCTGKAYTVKQIARVHRFAKQALKEKVE